METVKKEASIDLAVIPKGGVSMEAPLQKVEDREMTDRHIVDIDKWAASLARILEDVPQYMCKPGHPGRISRIPDNLREVDIKSYEPCFLSIGPYHRHKQSVLRMEKRKHCVLKWILEQNPELTLKDYLREIKSIETLARNFYSDVEMESGDFVQMLLLDSLYILTVFCGREKNIATMSHPNKETENIYREDTNERNNQINGDTDNDNIQTMTGENEPDYANNNYLPRWFWILLEHDIFLLENQLPFFVLQKVYRLAYGGSETRLIGCLKYEFNKLLMQYVTPNSEVVISPSMEVHHLLHLCHLFFRPTNQQESVVCQLPEFSQMFRLGSAVQLYDGGVRFETKSGSAYRSLLDITVDRHGKLYMPCLYVEDNTISLLRNLIALEQMKYPSLGLDVSAYAVFLLHLITIPEDVKLLRRKGIIQHHLASDKEMVYLINKLSVGLSFDYVEDKYILKPIFQELKRYSDRRVPRWNALLKHKYFSNPWTTISLLAASLLLLLTAVQTFYAVHSYYHPFFDGHN